MNQSPEIGKLAEALCKAQTSIEGAKEDAVNPYFKSKYADLTSVWSACKGSLTASGLSVMQTMEIKDEKIVLVTTLAHSSGQWIKSFLPIMAVKMDPQSVGSAITYARRYALAAMVGVCPVDDDAEQAMKPAREEEGPKKITEAQSAELDSLIKDDREAVGKILKTLSIKSIYDISEKDFNKTINWLKQRKETRESGSTRVA